MGFGQAIHTVFIKKYCTFSGRASRSEFWWGYLFYWIMTYVLYYLMDFFPENSFFYETYIFDLPLILYISFVLDIGLFIPFLAVGVRRIHDKNYTGLWYALFLISMNVLVTLKELRYFFNDSYMSFQTFLVSNNYIFYCYIISALAISITIFILLITRGTYGSNRFGPDPLQRQVDSEVFK